MRELPNGVGTAAYKRIFCHMRIACNAHKKNLEPPEIIAGLISPAKDLKPAALSTVDSIIFMSASAQSEG